MRVLVTGARGQLGGDLMDAVSEAGHEALGFGSDELDVTVESRVDELIGSMRPDAVANCAAWTRVDLAESEPEAARLVNEIAPGFLARACARTGSRLLHISTDYVFAGGGSEPLVEDAPARPVNLYGRMKLGGERAVRAALPTAQIVRSAWLFGRSGPNFILTILRKAREEAALRVVADQWGSPTWTRHLAVALVHLLERGTPGTYHVAAQGTATWYDVAREALDAADLEGVQVMPITTEQYPTPARRPAYTVLDCSAWRALGEAPLPPWQEGVRAYVASLATTAPRGHA